MEMLLCQPVAPAESLVGLVDDQGQVFPALVCEAGR